jgi:hypothetical protein
LKKIYFFKIPKFLKTIVSKLPRYYGIAPCFDKCLNEMLKISIQCTRFKTNYSNFLSRSSENTCSKSEGAKEKGKTG